MIMLIRNITRLRERMNLTIHPGKGSTTIDEVRNRPKYCLSEACSENKPGKYEEGVYLEHECGSRCQSSINNNSNKHNEDKLQSN